MTSATDRPRGRALPRASGALSTARTVADRLTRRLDSPVTSYYVLLAATSTLVVLGLVMVLSASMVTSYTDDGSSFAVFLNQARFAAIGLVGAIVAARLSPTWWRRLALPAMVGSLALQAAVFTPLGFAVNGNRNWLRVGPISVQPSEMTKLGLVLVGALVFANKGPRLRTFGQIAVPFVAPVALVTLGLVLYGKDLGTALILVGIVGAVLYAAGVPARFFVGAGLVAAAGVTVLVLTNANRVDRITNWLSGSCTDPNGVCGQSVHGLYALADGGWWGVGLGASKEKWSWLAAAHNDFIFAIVGEELGLPGTLTLLLLFAMISGACLRIVSRSRDSFVQIATAGIMAWILLQAMINIGAVIGLLPVIGLPLPMVSAGGSALVTTMIAMGILVSFARREPGAAEILATRPGVVSRSLSILPGRRTRR